MFDVYLKMEAIYKPEYFRCTENIKLEEYFKEFSSTLYEEQRNSNTVDEKILKFLEDDEVSAEHLKILNNVCSIDQLTVNDEQSHIDINYVNGLKSAAVSYHPSQVTPEALTLHSIKRAEERKKGKGKKKLFQELRQRSLQMRNSQPVVTGDPDLKSGESVIIVVRFFRPFQYHFSHPISFDGLKFDQEITLLGENTLADLRDKIKCNADVHTLKEEVENNDENISTAKDIWPSGFIFIDGVFYNDFRHERSTDYSEVIRRWASDKKISDFKTAEMNQTKLISLSPRFGYPYVYQHQGRCEHTFIFSHAHLINQFDPLSRNLYPFHSDIGAVKVVYCYFCGLSLPVWVVVGCDRLPRRYTQLCNDCYTSYCLIDGKKIGKFGTYPYTGRNALF